MRPTSGLTSDVVPARDQSWQAMAHFVIDNRGPWKKAVTERTGLAFNTVRLLRRIVDQPRSIGSLAEAVGVDAPAASVAVTQLEQAGLVERRVDTENRRRKVVWSTEAGRETFQRAMSTADPAPHAFDALDADEIAELHRIVAKLLAAEDSPISD